MGTGFWITNQADEIKETLEGFFVCLLCFIFVCLFFPKTTFQCAAVAKMADKGICHKKCYLKKKKETTKQQQKTCIFTLLSHVPVLLEYCMQWDFGCYTSRIKMRKKNKNEKHSAEKAEWEEASVCGKERPVCKCGENITL